MPAREPGLSKGLRRSETAQAVASAGKFVPARELGSSKGPRRSETTHAVASAAKFVPRLRSPNGGGGDRPRPGQALCWLRIAEMPLQGLTSAVALVLCIHTAISELLGHDEWGGLLSPQEKRSLRP